MPQPALFARPVPAALFIILSVLADQLIKYLVEIYLPFQQPVPIIPMLALYRTWNEGVAFSFLSGMSGWAIVGMRLLIVAFILVWWRKASQVGALMHLGFAMIVAGAVGNIIDRFIYGHVVDYVLFHTETWSFAVFNLADSLITVGAVIVGFSELFLQQTRTKDAN
jgi:signal peptidase II